MKIGENQCKIHMCFSFWTGIADFLGCLLDRMGKNKPWANFFQSLTMRTFVFLFLKIYVTKNHSFMRSFKLAYYEPQYKISPVALWDSRKIGNVTSTNVYNIRTANANMS